MPRLLTVAGIVHHKGLHDYLRALARLKHVLPDFHYVIIGGKRDNTYAGHLETLALELGLCSHISFLYDAPDSVKDAALRCADLYIQPSHEEGFCLAFLDAAFLVPRLLGTQVGEMPYIAGADRLCRVVVPGDIESLSKMTMHLLERPAHDSIISLRRARLKSEYSWSTSASRMVHLYERLLCSPAINKQDSGEYAIEDGTVR